MGKQAKAFVELLRSRGKAQMTQKLQQKVCNRLAELGGRVARLPRKVEAESEPEKNREPEEKEKNFVFHCKSLARSKLS